VCGGLQPLEVCFWGVDQGVEEEMPGADLQLGWHHTVSNTPSLTAGLASGSLTHYCCSSHDNPQITHILYAPSPSRLSNSVLSHLLLLLTPSLSPLVRYKSPGEAYVEGDASSASYFLAGATITGGTITVEGCGSDSLQVRVREITPSLFTYDLHPTQLIGSGSPQLRGT